MVAPATPSVLGDDGPMTRAQIAAVAGTVLLSALDGFDVLSVTFVAPAVAREFGVGKSGLGVVLAAGLAGMAVGSLALAPLADRVGRRALVLVSLGLMAAGMVASAGVGGVGALAAWRVVTGCGIGAMVAVIAPLAAEYASARRRDLAVALMAVGYPSAAQSAVRPPRRSCAPTAGAPSSSSARPRPWP